MTQKEQIRFIRQLSGNIVKEMEKRIRSGHVPESWDGMELRQWLADRCADASYAEAMYRRAPRRREYENTVLVNDL